MSRHPAGRVRIVAGARKGRRLRVPPGGQVRPTSEKVREAIFDVLGPIMGLSALDLFAGSGAMGLEALSRGAAQCVFVENDPGVAAILRANIASLEYTGSAKVMTGGYLTAAKGLCRLGTRFDLLFVDPPYRMLAEVEVMLSPLIPELVTPDGVAVVEGAKTVEVAFGQAPFFERAYGDTRITMIRTRRTST